MFRSSFYFLSIPTKSSVTTTNQIIIIMIPNSNPNTTTRQHPPNSPRPYFIITLSRPKPNPRKIRIRIPKALVKAMHRGGARSHRTEMEHVVSQQHGNGKGRLDSGKSGTPKGGSMMAGFFRKKKLSPHDERSDTNDVVSPSDAIQSSKPHLALSVPRNNKFRVQGIGHEFARKARLFRKVTWGKLPKKPVFRHPNLFRKDPGMKLLKSKVKKNECTDIVVPNRGIQRIRRILQGKQGGGVIARKSICQPETGMDDCDNDRKDGELELCKKRILIGYKCRPLGRSGTLRYDQNGILLPELFP